MAILMLVTPFIIRVLRKLKAVCKSYINYNRIHETGNKLDEEAKEMQEQISNEVGPHTVFHQALYTCSQETLTLFYIF